MNILRTEELEKIYKGKKFVIYQTPYEVEALAEIKSVMTSIPASEIGGDLVYDMYCEVKFLNTEDKGETFQRWVRSINCADNQVEAMKGKAAYIIVHSQKAPTGEYIACIAKEGEEGFYKTNWLWGDDYKQACEIAKEMNTGLGLSDTDVEYIYYRSLTPNGKDLFGAVYHAHKHVADANKSKGGYVCPTVY